MDTGFDPEAILDWSPLIFQTVISVLESRASEAEREQMREQLLAQVRGG